MANLMTVKLNKNVGASWGFRLQGGKDFATPLCIQKVNGGSVAATAGLQAGDAIVSIGGQDALSLRHKEAQDAIVRAGNAFEIVIQRGAQVWKPTVTALPEVRTLPEGVPVATKTSLAATPKDFNKPIGTGHNTAAAPFGEHLVNTQYNSPLNLYSEDSIAETLSAQAEVLGKGGVLGINFKKYAKEEKIRTDSPTYKLLHGEDEPERKARPAPLQSESGAHLPFQQDPTDQEGYYNINDKLYCDIHAKQAARANPPAPNMEPVTVQPGAPVPSGAVAAPQARGMKIPAAFQQPKGPVPMPAAAPIPFKPPVGGVRLMPTSPSALNTPTPFKRAPVSAPPLHQPFVPAPAPAPAPVVAAPPKPAPAPAPAFKPVANPQGFGAPAGDVNVRSHIPKKEKDGEKDILWPPHNFQVEDVSDPAPFLDVKAKKKATKPRPDPISVPSSKSSGPAKSYVMKPLPTSKHLPLAKPKSPTLPTSPTLKVSFKKTSKKSSSKSSTKSFTKSSTKSSHRKSPPKSVVRLCHEKFPNPAPSFILKLTSVNEVSGGGGRGGGGGGGGDDGDESQLYKLKGSNASMQKSLSASLLHKASSHLSSETSSENRPRVKTNISPIRSRPITDPMPTVDFNTRPDPNDAFEAALRKYASTFLSAFNDPPPPKSTPAPKSLSSRGFKAVRSPSAKHAKRAASPKVQIALPEWTPVENVTPIVLDIDSLEIVEGSLSD